MTRRTEDKRTAPDSTKENRRMSKQLSGLAALFGAATMLVALLAAPASAESPWWQVLSGSRPTNMWEADDSVQEIETQLSDPIGFGDGLAGKIEVNGKVVGCLASPNFVGEAICEGFIGLPATTSAAQLQALLESAFGTSAMEVSGGPAGGEPFLITVFGSGAPKVTVNTELEPGSKVFVGSATTTVVSPGGSGRLVVTATNLGDAPVDATTTPVTIKDKLPAGVVATGTEAFAGIQGIAGPVECKIEAPDEVICSFEGSLPSYETIEIEIYASLLGSPPVAGAPGKVTVSGGDAPSVSEAQTIKVSPEPTPYGVERFATKAEEEGGGAATQAGGHPFQFTATIQLNAGRVTPAPTRRSSETEQPALPRSLDLRLPSGLLADPGATAQCDMSTFLAVFNLHNDCPAESAIGVVAVTIVESSSLGFVRIAVPIFNLPPAYGEPARFGFVAAGAPVLIDTALDPDDKYRITASVNNVTQVAQFLSGTVSLWGTPGDPRHDSARGWNCVWKLEGMGPCERPPNLSEDAFLRQPVYCNSPLEYRAQTEPWNVPTGSVVREEYVTLAPLTGCNKVPFDPKVSAAPTSKLAENPSGLAFELNFPGSGLSNSQGIAEGQFKRIAVTVPEGMTLNPSAAEGLAVCSPAEYARERFDSKPGDGCPEASKLGNVQIQTPVLEEQVKGSLYIAKSYDNPFNSLLAVYILARVPERGILVKVPVKISPDLKTGQLIATVLDSPPLPISSFAMQFREGGRAPLVTPPACGGFTTTAKFSPWSAKDPDNASGAELVERSAGFKIEHGVDGGACPPGGVPPFDPQFQAGSINNDAGAHTDFNMRLIREDGEQNMTRFSAVLPPGVLGKLAGVDKCPNSAIAVAKAKTGHEEIASPSCPAGSRIGHSLVGAGVGSLLTRVSGEVYMGGAFNGAPLSVIAITPVVAGPFDVGTVVVREALNLNPKTAEVEVDGNASDPIPHILEGIPAKLRDLRVYVDRPDFIVNPTSCDESSVKSVLFGSYLDVFSSADDKPVDLSSRYQAANCANLGFKPDLKLNLKGGTKRGGHPGLKAIYTPRKGDANLKGLEVRLPTSAFLDQAHIRTICTRVQFAADSCPKAAQYGYIKAWTPLLEEPLQGPVWLRSSNHKLPDMVFDLHGLVDVEVATRIDSQRGGIRATLEDAPDAPISKVVLTMQGAKKGLIVNSKNLCSSTNKANASFDGQNGKEFSAKPVLRPDCGGKRKGKKR